MVIKNNELSNSNVNTIKKALYSRLDQLFQELGELNQKTTIKEDFQKKRKGEYNNLE